jgi:hypothetical protein
MLECARGAERGSKSGGAAEVNDPTYEVRSGGCEESEVVIGGQAVPRRNWYRGPKHGQNLLGQRQWVAHENGARGPRLIQ